MVTDIYNVVCGWISSVWIYKIQILGGIFLSLTIFEYLYRAYLQPIRLKQVNEIRKIFLEVKKINMKNKTRDELEHEVLGNNIDKLSFKLDSSIDKLASKVSANYEVLASQIKANNRVVVMQIDTEFELMNLRYDTSEKAIEGAVTRLDVIEEETNFIKVIRKYKWASLLALVGFVTSTNWNALKGLWVKIFN